MRTTSYKQDTFDYEDASLTRTHNMRTSAVGAILRHCVAFRAGAVESSISVVTDVRTPSVGCLTLIYI